jgi:simple sugar transport system permease protein
MSQIQEVKAMINNQSQTEELEASGVSTISEIVKKIAFPAISLFLALIFGIILLLFLELDVLNVIEQMTTQTLTDEKIAETLFYGTPLIFTGLSVAIAFRAGMFNIGTEGQMMVGAFVASLVGFGLRDYYGVDLPPILFIPLLMIAGTFGGAIWALIPALLKARGVHEVISTIMMNYIATTLMVFLVGGSASPFIDRSSINLSPQTPPIPESAELPLVFERLFSRLHWGFFIGIAMCIVLYIVLWKTKLGYETRTVGNNPDAAKYGGINVNSRLIIIMLISGGLGGLAGAVEVMGQFHMYLDKSLVGYGFDGIAVAIIGGNHPFGVIFGAILFGWLQNVTVIFQLPPYAIPKEVAATIKGIIVLLVAIPMISKIIFNNFETIYKGSWLEREVKAFWGRYHYRKETLLDYFRIEDKNFAFLVLAYVFLFICMIIWSILLALGFWLLIDRGFWFFDLIDFILLNFWTPILGPELGAIFTDIDGIFIWLIFFLFILFVFIKYGRNIINFLQYSYPFFIEYMFLSLKLSLLIPYRILENIARRIIAFFLYFFDRLEQIYLFIKRRAGEIGVTVLFLGIFYIYSEMTSLFAYLSVRYTNIRIFIFFFEYTSYSQLRVVFLFFVLILAFLIYVFNKRKLNYRDVSFLIFVVIAVFGLLEYLLVVEIAGQEVALFGTIFLVASFIIFQEYLANKSKISVWIEERKQLETTEENKTIIKEYSIFIGLLILLFILMVLIGKSGLPVQFFLPPEAIQNLIQIRVVFFNLKYYGHIISFTGIIIITFSYIYLRKTPLPLKKREVLYLPYYYITLAFVFVLSSLASFFSFNTLVLFTALVGAFILTTSKLLSYEWFIWKKERLNQQYTEVEDSKSSDKLINRYISISIILVVFAVVMSYFPFRIGPYVFPLILLLLIIFIGFFIMAYEWYFWKKSEINMKKSIQTKENEIGLLNKPVRFYLYLFTYLITFSILIIDVGHLPLPIQYDLFFFNLHSIGSLFGILNIVVIVIGIFFARNITIQSSSTLIKSFPTVFKTLAVLTVFQALYTFFEMDPFLLITLTLVIAAPIGFASLGGMFSEKSGVVNIGLEGMMLSGAFVSVMVTHLTNDPWAGVIGSIIAGIILGLVHAVASIKYRADQVVVGVAINLLASAVTALGIWMVWDSPGQSDRVRALPLVKLDFLANIPIIGPFLYDLTNADIGLSPLVYVFIATIFVSAWIIQRTTFGLRVRSVGEHPRAADTLGINVFKMRYICVILSGVLAAVGGAQLTLGWVPIFNKDMTGGRGFVALAALIFGSWNPIGAALASLFFGFAYSFRYQLEPQLSQLGIDWILFDLHLEDLTPMLPFVVTIIAVAFVAKRMRAPAADGIPYIKEG